jgi:aryl-alcohol dehydrogenase-like predicted oxidoreductase
MQRLGLGKTGDAVSAIAYGAMGLSVDGRPDPRTAARVVGEVLDAGFSSSTSRCLLPDESELGHNEALLVASRDRPDRDEIRNASKVGI